MSPFASDWVTQAETIYEVSLSAKKDPEVKRRTLGDEDTLVQEVRGTSVCAKLPKQIRKKIIWMRLAYLLPSKEPGFQKVIIIRRDMPRKSYEETKKESLNILAVLTAAERNNNRKQRNTMK